MLNPWSGELWCKIDPFKNQQARMDALEIEARLNGRLAQIVDPNPPSAAEAMIGMATAAYSGHSSVPEGTSWGDVFA